MSDPLLLAHPATAEMAERMAIDVSIAADGASMHRLRAAFIDLLSDLTRPESRDAWVRWLVAWDAGHVEEMVSVSMDASGAFCAYLLPTGHLVGVGDTELEAVSAARALIAVGHHRHHLRNDPTALLAAIRGVSGD